MNRYAENTTVTVERSEAELKALLRKHGAGQIATLTDDARGLAAVAFEIEGRRVRFELTCPTADDLAHAVVGGDEQPRGWKSWTPAKRKQWSERQAQQVERQRWRSLVLVTKAKLEIVADGQSSFEREFLADIVLPSGERVGDWFSPQLSVSYTTGRTPPLLPEAGTHKRTRSVPPK